MIKGKEENKIFIVTQINRDCVIREESSTIGREFGLAKRIETVHQNEIEEIASVLTYSTKA